MATSFDQPGRKLGSNYMLRSPKWRTLDPGQSITTGRGHWGMVTRYRSTTLTSDGGHNTFEVTVPEMHIVHRGILAADLIIPHRYMRLLVFTFVNSIRKEINPSEGLTLEIFDEALLKDHMQEAWEDTQCGLGFNQQTPVTAGTAFPTIPSDLVQAYIATIAANFRDIGETDERALQGIAEGSGHFADYADLDKIISNFGIVLEAEHAHAVFSALTHRITSGVSHALRSSIQARQRQINLLEKSAAETDMDDEETETEEGATNN